MILVAAPHVATKQSRLVLRYHNGMAEAGGNNLAPFEGLGQFLQSGLRG